MKELFRSLPKDAAFDVVESPVGNLVLVASDAGLHALLWDKDLKKYRRDFERIERNSRHPVIRKASKQLREYFKNERQEFELPVSIVSGTSFQQKAWQILRDIPYGQTISYKEQAQRVGDPRKARAVGSANSKNPLSIVVPCHRVISSSGDLSGFGGGKHVKRYLIDIENRFRRRSSARRAPNGFVR